MKIRLKLFVSFIIVLLSTKSFSQSGTSIAITAQSNAFKSLVGQDRITQFKALETQFGTLFKYSNVTVHTNSLVNPKWHSPTTIYRCLGRFTLLIKTDDYKNLPPNVC